MHSLGLVLGISISFFVNPRAFAGFCSHAVHILRRVYMFISRASALERAAVESGEKGHSLKNGVSQEFSSFCPKTHDRIRNFGIFRGRLFLLFE